MSDQVLPDPSTPFGERVRRRLREEQVIWFTTVGRDGTPEPNPVWFLWDGEGMLIYSYNSAKRLDHIRRNPRVSLNFNSDPSGGDVVILTGRATILADHPPASRWQPYLEKYGESIDAVSGSAEAFSQSYSVPVRVEVTNVRGF
jgi:PPOX class probable F420-dependent enzyme